MSKMLRRASQRLIDGIEEHRLLSKSADVSEEVIERFTTQADAVILSKSGMRRVLEQFTQELLQEQARILDEDSDPD